MSKPISNLQRKKRGKRGLAALAGAAFLIRDSQMLGNRITILEQQQPPGGAPPMYFGQNNQLTCISVARALVR